MTAKNIETSEERIQSKRNRNIWRMGITPVAAVIVFIVTYSLILPAITMSGQAAHCGCEEHTHLQECYSEEGELICGLEEHTHTLVCYADLDAEIEDADLWQQELPELTGDRSTDVVAVAKSLIGYRESDKNYLVAEGDETKGYTRFGHWYGMMADDGLTEEITETTDTAEENQTHRLENGIPDYSYWDWDAMFASYVLYYAGAGDMGADTDAGNWAETLAAAGLYVDASDYIPSEGDLVFFTPYADKPAMVGIVSNINRSFFGLGDRVNYISVICGDFDNEVSEIRISMDEYREGDLSAEIIRGYGLLNPDAPSENPGDDTSGSDSSMDAQDDLQKQVPSDTHVADEAAMAAEGDQSSADRLDEGDQSSVDRMDESDQSSADQMDEGKTSADADESALTNGENLEDEKPSDSANEDTSAPDDMASTMLPGEIRTLTANGSDYTVTMTYGADAAIPDVAKLWVEEIKVGTDDYEECLADTRETLGIDEENADKLHGRFFDIKIMTKEGEFEPKSPVKVEISYKKPIEAAEASDFHAIHFGEDGTERIDVETSGRGEMVTAVEFAADSFSIYGVVYTVDIHWEIDGRNYEFSIPGGGYATISQIVELLGITKNETESQNANEYTEKTNSETEKLTETKVLTLDDVVISGATREFVANISNVEFSDTSLMWIGKVEETATVGQIKAEKKLDVQFSAELTEKQITEINSQTVESGDWALVSLKAFRTDESLTITMKTGEVFTVKVTDGQLHTYVISDSGDTYEVIVTYDDTAGIPEDAELRVSQISSSSLEYAQNVQLVNRKFAERNETEFLNPLQFSIDIVSEGKIIEPKEGSLVSVEVRLARLLLEEECSSGEVEDDSESQSDEDVLNDEQGLILFNGQEIKAEGHEITGCRVAHITDDGNAESIDEVQNTFIDNLLVLQFDTESFSDYLFDTEGNNYTSSLSNLPDKIYVGDEIYIYEHSNYNIYGQNSVVTVTDHSSNNFRTVKAIATGNFTISNNRGDSKTITVLSARTGTTPPRALTAEDGIIENSSMGLTLNLFDYDLNDQLDSYYNNYNHDNHPVSSVFLNAGINNNHILKFWGSGIGNQHGAENQYNAHKVTGIVASELSNGYPKLKNYNETLAYLFDPSLNTDDRRVYENANGLFKKVDDYYVYDSNTNYAWYDEENNSFVVYESTYEQKSRSDGGEQAANTNGKPIGFFPFHKWDDEYDLYVNWNKKLNHHFGLAMSVDFVLPGDPKAVKDTHGRDIVFEFSGDDDLWVFIDGKLAMDIGGVHQPTSGTINFTNKEVWVNNERQYGYNFDSLYDGNKHTLQVFYIERGGCDSNCMIKFNITRYGDVEFDKVDAEDNSKNLAGAIFALYRDQACTQPLMEQLNNGTSRAFVKVSADNGHVEFDGIPLGTYYLKEIGAPEGYPVENRIWTISVVPDEHSIKANVYIDGKRANYDTYGDNVQILNQKPEPIDLTLEKVWRDPQGNTVNVPDDASATFELKRIRTYETITEIDNPGSDVDVSKLKVGWIHNGQTHIYKEYDMISGSTATISWGYRSGYTGESGCIKNGTKILKSNTTDIYSEAVTMSAAGGEATLYIIDTSEQGDAITSINVAGREFIGNSGGGKIHEFTRVIEPDPYFCYTADHTGNHALDRFVDNNNRVTLPVNEQWSYNFVGLPLYGVDSQTTTVYNYSYYLEEVSCSNPSNVTVIYKDSQGNAISNASDAETSVSGTQTITNQVNVGSLLITKNVLYNGREAGTDEEREKVNKSFGFKVKKDGTEITGNPYSIVVSDGKSDSVLIPDLEPGDYTIEEIRDGDLVLISAAGGKSVSEDKAVTVTVTAGKLMEADLLDNAKAAFINNLAEYEVIIIKTDMGNDSTKLGGAEFVLYAEDAIENDQVREGAMPIKEDLISSFEQDSLGKVSLGKLEAGTYYLIETKAPDGYVMLDAPIRITVTDGRVSLTHGTCQPQEAILQGSKTSNDASQNNLTEIAELIVRNNPGVALPNTGGSGTILYYMLGLLMFFLAGAGGIVMKRKRGMMG